MKRDAPSYHGYRFPPEIISHAVWLYHRFGVSFRDVEDLLAQRGITVSYEAIRLWCLTFGSAYARRLKRRQGRLGDTWYLDEVFVTIQGWRHSRWRAVDQDGDVIDILVQSRRDCRVQPIAQAAGLSTQLRMAVRVHVGTRGAGTGRPGRYDPGPCQRQVPRLPPHDRASATGRVAASSSRPVSGRVHPGNRPISTR